MIARFETVISSFGVVRIAPPPQSRSAPRNRRTTSAGRFIELVNAARRELVVAVLGHQRHDRGRFDRQVVGPQQLLRFQVEGQQLFAGQINLLVVDAGQHRILAEPTVSNRAPIRRAAAQTAAAIAFP